MYTCTDCSYVRRHTVQAVIFAYRIFRESRGSRHFRGLLNSRLEDVQNISTAFLRSKTSANYVQIYTPQSPHADVSFVHKYVPVKTVTNCGKRWLEFHFFLPLDLKIHHATI